MHPEQAALLRMICEQPGEDAPPLIYADWLEEHGEEDRAEFIRVQIERDALPESHPNRPLLSLRAEVLLRAHEGQWRAERPELPGVHWGSFQRGFIDRLTLDDGSVLRHAELLFESGPVDALIFRRVGASALSIVAECGYLSRVRSLGVLTTMSSESEIRSLLQSPYLCNLEELRLSDVGVGLPVMEVIAREPHFGRLHRLFLANNRIGFPAAEVFARSRTLPQMSLVSLFRNPLGDAGVERLAEAPHLQQVGSLELQNTRCGDIGVRALARSGVWSRGTFLNLCYNQIGNAGARYLAERPHLAHHRVIVLRSNQIGDEGAEALAASPFLEHIESLELGSNTVMTEDGRIEMTAHARRVLRKRFGDRVHL